MKELWYAVQANEEDNDWGEGFWSKDEAVDYCKNHDYYRIAVIDNEECIQELYNGEDF